jgi:tetratricopeptide (TPR) repeat protein/GTPase SAR1 family protein
VSLQRKAVLQEIRWARFASKGPFCGQEVCPVTPILLRPVDWQDALFGQLQCLPHDGKPVTEWDNQDAAFRDIAQGIRRAIEQPTTSVRLVPHLSPLDRQNRVRLLKGVRKRWTEGVLKHSLHQEALITLDLEEQPDALANPWRLEVQETNLPPHLLPAGTSITKVYDEADGKLLILGEPGSGKTTLLLELTRDLLDRAEQDETHPMPVVFNLPSWAEKRQRLIDWLAEELKQKYQVPLQLAKSWLATDGILPLLDGLDEVAPAHRVACLNEINAYRGEHNLASLVVCSRSKEYFSQTTRIQLHNAVTVQPLTVQQIDDYLVSAGEQLAALRTVLHHDTVLHTLATNPLFLSVLTLTYHGKTIEDLTTTGTPEMRRRQIFAAYVKRMLEHRGVAAHYTSQQTIDWLKWLASRMAQHYQTEFYLHSMQPDWLWEKRLRRYYEWMVGRPVIWVLWALLRAVYSGLLAILVVILVSAMAAGISKEVLGALLGIFPGAVLISFVSGILHGWRKGLSTAAVAIPVGALFGALTSSLFSGLDRPYLGLIVGLVTGGVIGLFASIISREGYSGIFTAPVVGWSWEEVRLSFNRENKDLRVASVLGGVSSILVGAVVTVEKGVFSGLGMGGVMLLAGLLLFVLYSGIQRKSLSKHMLVAPNQWIGLAVRKGLYFCLAVGSCAFIGTWLVISSVAGMAMGWTCALIAGVVFGVTIGAVSDWEACVRHLVLRELLWKAGSLPRNYAHFLDYAVERSLLRKLSSGYIFAHRLLLEYFAMAEMETKRAQLVKPDAKDATIYHNQGEVYAGLGEYDRAIANYTRAIELDPKEVSVYSDRGLAYARRKEYQQAIADYTRAIELDPKDVWTYYQRGSVYHDLKEYEKAIVDFTQVIKLAPKEVFPYRDRARCYRLNKEYEKAIADLSRAMELAPQDIQFYRVRGHVYVELKEHEKAIADFSRAIELAPQEAWFYYYRGKIYVELEEYEKAIADFSQAIRLEPGEALFYRYRGRAQIHHKEYQQAFADFTHAIELYPQNAWLYLDRGLVSVALEEYEKAIADFSRAIELEPSDADLYTRRGAALQHIKAHEQAVADFTHAIELDPTYGRAYFCRGYAYLWLKKRKLASADFVQYAALAPDSVKAAWMVIYSNLGKQRPGSEIIESLEKTIAIAPQSATAQICQGIVLGLWRDYSTSIAQLERSLQLGRSVEDAYFWKGVFCAYLGQEAEATQAIMQALEAGLPPILLTPLYWLEQERPEMYQSCAVPFLLQYGV